MRKKTISLILAFALIFGLFPIASFAADGADKDLSEGYEVRFEGESWKPYTVEDIDDALTVDDLRITVVASDGSEVPCDAYTLVIGYETEWDDENNMPLIDPSDGPYDIKDGEDKENGFSSYGAYAVAKDGSGYTGTTRTNEFMIWHKYSFNWFGGSISFGNDYKSNSQWFWHDYYDIPEGSIETPKVYDITGALVDPSLYTLTYYSRAVHALDDMDGDDPEYEDKLYPTDEPLDEMPQEPGFYFACAESKDPYYGTAWVDFDIYETSGDLSDGAEMRFNGKNWMAYSVENIDDAISLDDLHISVVNKNGRNVPKDAYEIVVGIVTGFDEENWVPIVTPVEGPYGILDDEESRREGFSTYAAYAVAKEGSGFTGQVRPQSFPIFHKYSLNYIGCNATFGDEYHKQSTWSWHDYYEIPEDKMHAPEVFDISGEWVDPDLYTITYYKRNISAPMPPGEGGEGKGYPKDDPMKFPPDQPGSYYAEIVGKEPYYGTGYVDFDILEATGEEGEFEHGFKLRFNGETWGDYYLDGKEDTLTVDELNITLVKGGKEIVPEDKYELHFSYNAGRDEETDLPIIKDVTAPFGLSYLPEAMERGWLMHHVYAVAKDDSGYTGQTPDYEFMIKDKYTLDHNSGMIDFGEEYLARSYRSWHYFYEIPASEMHEPIVTDLLGNELDADDYTLTYFERDDSALDDEDTDYDKLYCEDKPLSGMPTEAGRYFVRLDGKGDYYGVNYTDFDIVDSYAQAYGSKARWYDGYTIYMGPDETIKLTAFIDPGYEDMVYGWLSDDLNEAGFHLAEEPDIIDGVAYAVIDTNGMTEPSEGTLTFNWYKQSELFGDDGWHWDTAKIYYSSTIRIKMQPDAKLLGDADGSGEVDVIDATAVQRKIVGLNVPYTDDILMRGDIDGDGELTIVDATFIQRYSTHVKTNYPIGEPIGD